MKPKPRHLGPEYGSQWQDRGMAAAYHHRPPYPALVFDVLKRVAQPGPVLEIGAGTGDATIELAWRFERVDAVEPSAAMLAVAQRRMGRNIRWIHASFEEAELQPLYGLVVAAESLQWTDWQVSLPKIEELLTPGGVLALLSREEAPPPWQAELAGLLRRYSTNQDYAPYELVEELVQRKLFRALETFSSLREKRLLPLDAYIESFHSRNGFSRQRMTPEDARSFDAALRELLRPHLKEGLVPLTTWAQLT